MCRAAWLLLVGCSSAASRPAVDPAPARAERPEPPPATSTSTGTHARIVVQTDSWMDVSFEGNSDEMRAICVRFVESLLAGLSPTEFRLQRPCLASALPAAPAGPPLLVSVQTIDESTIAVDDILHGRRDQGSGDAAPRVRGQLVTYKPFAELAACDAWRMKADAQEQQAWLDFERTRIAEIDRKLPDAIAAQTEACARAATEADRCTKLRGDAQKTCVLDAQVPRITCDEMTRRRGQLDAERKIRPTPPGTSRTCR